MMTLENNKNGGSSRRSSSTAHKKYSLINGIMFSNQAVINGSMNSSFITGNSNKPHDFGETLTLNVSGCRFQTFESTLGRYPDTLLGDPSRRRTFFNEKTNEYFFDRHRASFEAILYFYQSNGYLRRPGSVPIDIFLKELRFFEMNAQIIEKFWISEGYEKPNEMPDPTRPWQRCIWRLIEQPDTSRGAKAVALFSVFVILLSTVSFCLETIPEFKAYFKATNNNSTLLQYSKNGKDANFSFMSNGTRSHRLQNLPTIQQQQQNAEDNEDGSRFDVQNPFFVVEFSCVCWFTIEFIARFVTCPQKFVFCKSFLNIIDFIAIVPFFINLVLSSTSSNSPHHVTVAAVAVNNTNIVASHVTVSQATASSSMSFAILRVFRLVRVFRVFKLSRHSSGLRILGKTFQASVQELMLLAFFMMIGLVLFSSGMYFAESGIKGSKFDSIPAAFWFSIVSMTTVGYGDLVPIGVYGKIVGSMCAIVGVLVLALPVPVIVSNFKRFYNQERCLTHMLLEMEEEHERIMKKTAAKAVGSKNPSIVSMTSATTKQRTSSGQQNLTVENKKVSAAGVYFDEEENSDNDN